MCRGRGDARGADAPRPGTPPTFSALLLVFVLAACGGNTTAPAADEPAADDAAVTEEEHEGEEHHDDHTHGDDDYYGIIKSRPDGTAGEWVINGRSFTATDDTELEDDDGPLVVGACVSVDFEGSIAEEIESEPASDCQSSSLLDLFANTAYAQEGDEHDHDHDHSGVDPLPGALFPR